MRPKPTNDYKYSVSSVFNVAIVSNDFSINLSIRSGYNNHLHIMFLKFLKPLNAFGNFYETFNGIEN